MHLQTCVSKLESIIKNLIGRALMKFPVFAKAIQKCNTVLSSYGIQLTNILTNDKNIFDNIINLLLALTGLQVRRKFFRLKLLVTLYTYTQYGKKFLD